MSGDAQSLRAHHLPELKLSKRSKRSRGVRDERAAQQSPITQMRAQGERDRTPASIYQAILTKYMAILNARPRLHERQTTADALARRSRKGQAPAINLSGPLARLP